jgi:phosphinothricin acetyltransferase
MEERHLAQARDIFNHYVAHSTATFFTEPLTPAEMRETVLFEEPRYATFIILDGDKMCGYVTIKRYDKRQAYDHTAYLTLILEPNHTAKGIGGLANAFIEQYARENGFRVLVASVSEENDASVKLLTKTGYEKCAHFREVGLKFGRLLDVVMYQKILR